MYLIFKVIGFPFMCVGLAIIGAIVNICFPVYFILAIILFIFGLHPDDYPTCTIAAILTVLIITGGIIGDTYGLWQ